MCREGHQLPPRRLEPITNQVVAKKRKRAKKKDRPTTATPDQTVPSEGAATTQGEGTPTSLLGESVLSQLRARLDPIYNPPPQDSALPPLRLPPLGQTTDGQPVPTSSVTERDDTGTTVERNPHQSSLVGSEEENPRKRSRRRVKQKQNEAELASNQHTDHSQAGATSEQVVDEENELKTTSKDELLAGSERRKRRKRRQRERTGKVVEASVDGEDVPDTGDRDVSVAAGEQVVDSNVETTTQLTGIACMH